MDNTSIKMTKKEFYKDRESPDIEEAGRIYFKGVRIDLTIDTIEKQFHGFDISDINDSFFQGTLSFWVNVKVDSVSGFTLEVICRAMGQIVLMIEEHEPVAIDINPQQIEVNQGHMMLSETFDIDHMEMLIVVQENKLYLTA